MKATLVFVPVGGGEQDYSLDFELPSVPQKGDYISVFRPKFEIPSYPGEQERADFIVRRTWWYLDFPTKAGEATLSDERSIGTVSKLYVECEYALGEYSNERHKSIALSAKNQRNGLVKKFEESMF
jgi:hypothetical protein